MLTVYVVIALINLNIVQTLLGSLAANYFSKEWKATVRIGGISLNPINHLSLHNLLVVDPKGDTVLRAEKIRCSFSGFPVKNGLSLRKVYLEDTKFNLQIVDEGLNLDFIIDYFKSDKPKEDKPPGKPFPVKVKALAMRNVDFSIQMKDTIEDTGLLGVDLKHMQFNHIYADIKDIVNIKDSVHAVFVNFKTIEKSGFTVENIAMDATVSRKGISVKKAQVKTKNSNLYFDASLKYRDWKTMKYFIDSVQMSVKIKDSSYGNMCDAGYWAPSLWGMDEKVNVSGEFEGTVSDLQSKFFSLSFGNQSKLIGNASIKGLPKINHTLIKARIQRLTTTIDELNSVSLPKSMTQIKIPVFLQKIGSVELSADFEGTIRDFSVLADIKSDVGDLHADLLMAYNESIKDYSYKGVIESAQLEFNNIVDNEWVKNIGLDISFEGSGTSIKTLDSKVEGKWINFDLRQNNYDSLLFSVKAENGKFMGNLKLRDNDINFDFSGLINMSSSKVPEFKFTSEIRNANIAKLNLTLPNDSSASSFLTRLKDSNVIFSAKINADFEGLNIDEIKGGLTLTDIQYTEQNKQVQVKNISVVATDSNNYRNLLVNSDLFDFEMFGYFSFDNFVEIINRFRGNYFPQTFYKSSILRYAKNKEPQDFDFELNIKDIKPVATLFFSNISISPHTKLSGKYHDLGGLLVNVLSDSLSLGSIFFKHLNIVSGEENDFYHLKVKIDSIGVANALPIQNIETDIHLKSETVYLKLNWNDGQNLSLNNGNINLTIDSRPFDIGAKFMNSQMVINGKRWTINPSNYLSYSETDINISNLIFEAKDQKIAINSEISEDGADELSVEFNDFRLDQFDLLLDDIGLRSSGLVNGTFQLKDFSKTPYFKSNLSINNLIVNDEKLGDASIVSSLDNRNERLNVDFSIVQKGNKGTYKPISAQGYIYPQRETDNYDFSIGFQNFKLKTIAGYLKSFASDFDGNLSGSLKVDGAFSVPKVNGELAINFGKMRVKMLNTTYNFADKITIKENAFEIKNFTLTDSLANKATVTGRVSHNNFKHFNFDLGLQTNMFIFMNTEASYNTPYYGKAIASGNVKIKGPLEDLAMEINARTGKGTDMNILVNNRSQLPQTQMVKFISKEFDSIQKKDVQQDNSLNLKLNINLAATSDAKISVPLSFSNIGSGNLTDVSGDGDLRLVIDTRKGDFLMYGNYTIASGGFKLNLRDIITTPFSLEKGGTIYWSGNVADATVDVSAIYSVKASLAPLLSSTGNDSEANKKTTTVESVINLKGKLLNPDIKFDIRFPRADQEVEEFVYSVIDRNNESQMMQQTIYLLLLSEFAPVSGSSNGGIGAEAVMAGVINTALSRAANIVGGFISFVDIGANYKPAETGGGVSDRIGVTISKDAGRWYFMLGADMEVNKTNSSDVQDNNSFVSEFIVGYRITNNFSVRGFSVPNTSTFSKDASPYISGIGVVYQQDFDRIIELFRKKKKTTEVIKNEQ